MHINKQQEPIMSSMVTTPLTRAAVWSGVFALIFIVMAVLLISASLQSNKQYKRSQQSILPTVVTAIAAALFLAQAALAAGVSYYAWSAAENIDNAVTKWTKRVFSATTGLKLLNALIGAEDNGSEDAVGGESTSGTGTSNGIGPIGTTGGNGTTGGSGSGSGNGNGTTNANGGNGTTDGNGNVGSVGADTGNGNSGNGAPKPSFQSHIKSLFRPSDVQVMKDIRGFDLHNYEDVKQRAETINSRLNDETNPMPCDGLWPKAKRDLFKRWIDTGMQP